MNRFLTRFLAHTLLLAVAAPAVAQAFQASDTTTYGNWYAGGSTAMRANGTVTLPSLADPTGPTRLDVTASQIANIRLFGVQREAAAMAMSLRIDHVLAGFSGNGFVWSNTSTASYVLRIGGRTMSTDNRTNTILSNNLAADVWLGESPRMSVSLLGLSVDVRGNATGRARYTLTPSVNLGSNFSIAVNGPIRTSSVGSAFAAVGVLGATAGVTSTLTYADTSATLDAVATRAGVTGSISGTVQQIRLFLDVFAGFLGATASQRLVDIVTPARSYTRSLQQS